MHTPAPEPFDRFRELFAQAEKAQPKDPNACFLATADKQGRPSVRTVLLKGVDAKGFVVYTNQQSRKGRELQQNPFASLLFYWPALDVQVRAEGPVEVVDAAESDLYFQTRPHLAQVGAWTSQQSQTLDARATLEERFKTFGEKYQDQPVPRPPHWGGYRLVPDHVEFWKAGEYRLHHRELYLRAGAGWEKSLLYP